MNNKQLLLLFGIMVSDFTVAIGLLPFLPLHATSNLGIDPSQTGIFLSIISVALTAGTIGGGWLSDRFRRRKLIILISGFIGFPSLFLISFTTNLFQLTILAACAWLAIGMSTTMVRIITGILADESQRGRIFGVIGAATPLSSLIGGVFAGPIVDRWDIPTLIVITSGAFVLHFVLGLFVVETAGVGEKSKNVKPTTEGLGMSYWLLAAASLMLFTAIACVIAARPLHMDRLGYDGSAISQILVPGAILSLPLTLYIGAISDRFGRKNMLVFCFGMASIGMALLIISEPLWHFWLSEIFLTFAGTSATLAAALAVDIVPRNVLDTALARITSMAWVGSIIGFAISGYIMDGIGINRMFAVATLIAIIGLCLLFPIQYNKARLQVAV